MKSIKTILPILGLLAISFLSHSQVGSLDSSFHVDGVTFFHFPGGHAVASSIAVLPNEKILVTGTVVDGEGHDSNILLLRYNPDGTLDPSFGDDGITMFSWGGQDDFAKAMAVQPDGRILVGGWTVSNDKAFGLITRFMDDGQLDTSFDGDGIIYSDIEMGYYGAMDVFVTSDGKVLWCFNGDGHSSSWIGRFLSNGDIDTSFGDEGKVVFSSPFTLTSPTWAALPDDGTALMGRLVDDTGNTKSFFIKYNKAGKMKGSSFGFDGDNYTHDAIATDDAVYAVGSRHYSETEWRISVGKYGFDGKFTDNFAANGRLFTKTGGTDEAANAIAIHLDGKLVVVGQDDHPTDKQLFVGRFDTDGQEDDGFGTKGWLKLNFSPGPDIAHATAIDADDRILVAGRSGDSLMVARLFGSKYTGPTAPGVDSTFFGFRPNPVGALFTADYGLPTDGLISLELVDIFGRQVHAFYREASRQAGHYIEPIAIPNHLPNGTYLLRFHASSFHSIQKMVVAKK